MFSSYSYQGLNTPIQIAHSTPNTLYSSRVTFPDVSNDPSLSGARVLSRQIIYRQLPPQFSYPANNPLIAPTISTNIVPINSFTGISSNIIQENNQIPIQYPFTANSQIQTPKIQNTENILNSAQFVKLIPSSPKYQNTSLTNQGVDQNEQRRIGNIVKTNLENNNEDEYSNDSINEEEEEFDKTLFKKFQKYKAQKTKERKHYFIEERPISKNVNLLIKHPADQFNRYHQNRLLSSNLNEENEFLDFIGKAKNKGMYTQTYKKRAGSLSRRNNRNIEEENRYDFNENAKKNRNQSNLNSNQNTHTFDDQNIYRLIPVSPSIGSSYNIPANSNIRFEPNPNISYSMI